MKACLKNIKLNSLIAAGNTKIPKSTAIFNMGTAEECPSRKLGFCQAFDQNGKSICYADKAERMYPDSKPYRKRQELYWKNITAKEFVDSFIAINKLKKTQFKAIRINEAGDFHSQECVDKMESIAKELSKHGIKVYGYTSRKDLDFSKVKYMVLSGSNFEKEGLTNIFKMVLNINDKPSGYKTCKGDCSICKICLIRGNKTVIVKH